MPKSFRHLVQALACLALLASASLQAQESRLDRILESGVLRVATTGDYKPFSYRTEEGGYAGFDVDMAQRLAESLGGQAGSGADQLAEPDARFRRRPLRHRHERHLD